MDIQYYIHNLHKNGFDLNKLPTDLKGYAMDVLNQPISLYNAKIELLDTEVFNAIKTLHPNNPIVQKVAKNTITDINIITNNGFNTQVEE